MSTQEYLNEIREASGLARAIITGITVEKRTGNVFFELVTDVAYTAEDKAWAEKISKKYLRWVVKNKYYTDSNRYS